MDLKIKDVADILRVSETTVRRWLQEKKIPAYRISGQYRFSRQEIQNWMLKENRGQTVALVDCDPNEDLKLALPSGNQHFSLYRAIHKGGVLHDVPGKTKKEVIESATKMIAKKMNLDADALAALLLERENLQPTALNHGIAVPHTRDFLLSAHFDVVTVVFPKHPLAYGALDGSPVHTLFFLFACDDKKHLQLLAKLAHLSSQETLLSLLQKKPEKDALLEQIKQWEAKLCQV